MMDETKRERDQQFRTEALRWLPAVARFALSLTRDEADWAAIYRAMKTERPDA